MLIKTYTRHQRESYLGLGVYVTCEYKSSRFDCLIDESCARDRPNDVGKIVVVCIYCFGTCRNEMAEESF